MDPEELRSSWFSLRSVGLGATRFGSVHSRTWAEGTEATWYFLFLGRNPSRNIGGFWRPEIRCGSCPILLVKAEDRASSTTVILNCQHNSNEFLIFKVKFKFLSLVYVIARSVIAAGCCLEPRFSFISSHRCTFWLKPNSITVESSMLFHTFSHAVIFYYPCFLSLANYSLTIKTKFKKRPPPRSLLGFCPKMPLLCAS